MQGNNPGLGAWVANDGLLLAQSAMALVIQRLNIYSVFRQMAT